MVLFEPQPEASLSDIVQGVACGQGDGKFGHTDGKFSNPRTLLVARADPSGDNMLLYDGKHSVAATLTANARKSLPHEALPLHGRRVRVAGYAEKQDIPNNVPIVLHIEHIRVLPGARCRRLHIGQIEDVAYHPTVHHLLFDSNRDGPVDPPPPPPQREDSTTSTVTIPDAEMILILPAIAIAAITETSLPLPIPASQPPPRSQQKRRTTTQSTTKRAPKRSRATNPRDSANTNMSKRPKKKPKKESSSSSISIESSPGAASDSDYVPEQVVNRSTTNRVATRRKAAKELGRRSSEQVPLEELASNLLQGKKDVQARASRNAPSQQRRAQVATVKVGREEETPRDVPQEAQMLQSTEQAATLQTSTAQKALPVVTESSRKVRNPAKPAEQAKEGAEKSQKTAAPEVKARVKPMRKPAEKSPISAPHEFREDHEARISSQDTPSLPKRKKTRKKSIIFLRKAESSKTTARKETPSEDARITEQPKPEQQQSRQTQAKMNLVVESAKAAAQKEPVFEELIRKQLKPEMKRDPHEDDSDPDRTESDTSHGRKKLEEVVHTINAQPKMRVVDAIKRTESRASNETNFAISSTATMRAPGSVAPTNASEFHIQETQEVPTEERPVRRMGVTKSGEEFGEVMNRASKDKNQDDHSKNESTRGLPGQDIARRSRTKSKKDAGSDGEWKPTGESMNEHEAPTTRRKSNRRNTAKPVEEGQEAKESRDLTAKTQTKFEETSPPRNKKRDKKGKKSPKKNKKQETRKVGKIKVSLTKLPKDNPVKAVKAPPDTTDTSEAVKKRSLMKSDIKRYPCESDESKGKEQPKKEEAAENDEENGAESKADDDSKAKSPEKDATDAEDGEKGDTGTEDGEIKEDGIKKDAIAAAAGKLAAEIAEMPPLVETTGDFSALDLGTAFQSLDLGESATQAIAEMADYPAEAPIVNEEGVAQGACSDNSVPDGSPTQDVDAMVLITADAPTEHIEGVAEGAHPDLNPVVGGGHGAQDTSINANIETVPIDATFKASEPYEPQRMEAAPNAIEIERETMPNDAASTTTGLGQENEIGTFSVPQIPTVDLTASGDEGNVEQATECAPNTPIEVVEISDDSQPTSQEQEQAQPKQAWKFVPEQFAAGLTQMVWNKNTAGGNNNGNGDSEVQIVPTTSGGTSATNEQPTSRAPRNNNNTLTVRGNNNCNGDSEVELVPTTSGGNSARNEETSARNEQPSPRAPWRQGSRRLNQFFHK